MKAVFFDFDGTLTKKGTNIWKAIWEECGYDVGKDSYYASLFNRFVDGKITHKQWCDLTCEKFREAGFTKDKLIEIADRIELMDGLDETLEVLMQYGFSLHIISGNIVLAIEHVLGRRVDYFESINANNFVFDENGVISKIIGTAYDFEGKAKFINMFKENTGSKDCDLYFVGNSSNDEWVHESGCRTICINPDGTEFGDKTKWHITRQNVSSLTEILDLIDVGIGPER